MLYLRENTETFTLVSSTWSRRLIIMNVRSYRYNSKLRCVTLMLWLKSVYKMLVARFLRPCHHPVILVLMLFGSLNVINCNLCFLPSDSRLRIPHKYFTSHHKHSIDMQKIQLRCILVRPDPLSSCRETSSYAVFDVWFDVFCHVTFYHRHNSSLYCPFIQLV